MTGGAHNQGSVGLGPGVARPPPKASGVPLSSTAFSCLLESSSILSWWDSDNPFDN
jgi:hypothetical protein